MKWLPKLRSLTASKLAAQPCNCSDGTTPRRPVQSNLEQQLYLSKPWF